MDRPPKRKSLLAQQAALAGVSFDARGSGPSRPDSMRLNALPELVTPIGRPANQPASHSRVTSKSKIPSAVRPPSSVQCSSGRPRLDHRSKLGSRSNSSTNLHRTMTRSNSSTNLHRTVTRPQVKPTVPKSTMRRSVSMESFGPMSANRSAFTTPLNRG
ncbi:unnamed protein product [Allacma fusca]|uniref:Uncharacterized protein n=1 Tax=Allacma fusca TaxID=39272 RepID=A0A8J2P0Z5_9HEXA|nr:unnamed protein product [Allacma fusca]